MSQIPLIAAQKLKEKLDLHEIETNGWTANTKNALKAFKLRITLKEKLLESESCSAWFQNLPNFQDTELKSKLEMYAPAGFQDFSLSEENSSAANNDAVDADLSNLKYSAIEQVAKRCIVAHILLVLKQYEKVPVAVLGVYNLIEDCVEKIYFSYDYALGFWYVARGLEIAYAIETKIKDSEKDEVQILKSFVQDLDLFHNFSDKNQVGVLALKQFFIGKMSHTSHELHLEVIYYMIHLDPQNFEWYYYLYITRRFQRKSVQEDGMPCEGEIDAIQRALSFEEAYSDPRILLSYIVCLSEIHRDRLIQGQQQGSFQYGDLVFSTIQGFVDFITTTSEKILSIDPTSVRVNHEIARMFLLFHPRTIFQLRFSKACIQRALLFHPNSSKANHRMGVYYISSRDLPSALPYIQKSYAENKSNTFALEDLLRLYMKDVKKNSTELTSIFDEALSSGYFQKCPKTISKLLFLKAIYALFIGKQREMVDLLIRSFTTWEQALEYFRSVGITVQRFDWYEKVPGEIMNEIKNTLSNKIIQCTDIRRKIKLEKLYEAASKETGFLPPRFSYASSNIQTGNGTGGFYRDLDSLNSVQRSSSSVMTGNWRDSDNGNNWRSKDHVLEAQTVATVDNNWRSGMTNQPDFVNPLNVLGVAQPASKLDIDKAYVRLVKANQSGDLVHEDSFQNQEHMMRINKAWELLQQ